jgi:hypothetical protein
MATSVNLVTITTQPIFTSVVNTAITFMSFCNHSATPVTINMYVVPAGETVSNSCLVYSLLQIPPYDTYQIYVGNEKLILAPGDMIYSDADIDSVVNVVTSYTSV